uniref:Uncharacterized protein n=1 Tax=Podarcis muralis TaxID=64176 RepID=A0A670KKW5_PODMU
MALITYKAQQKMAFLGERKFATLYKARDNNTNQIVFVSSQHTYPTIGTHIPHHRDTNTPPSRISLAHPLTASDPFLAGLLPLPSPVLPFLSLASCS